MKYYPAFINLKDKKVVVVGGGKVAERKILSLNKAGANVKVISPSLTKRLLREREMGRIIHIARNYRRNDLKGVFLVIAATDSSEINTQIAEDAPALVNVVDVPSECNFIAPSLVQRGDLIIAISTSGASPALSKAIRKELEGFYSPEFTYYLKLAKDLRERAMAEIKNRKKRESFLKSLASRKILHILRVKGFHEVKKILTVPE